MTRIINISRDKIKNKELFEISTLLIIHRGDDMNPTERFNLLVTFKGHKTSEAGEELLGIEEIELALQDEKNLFDVKETEFQNVVLIESGSDPLLIKQKLADAPTTVISKIVPIELVVRTRPDLIAEKVSTISRDKIKSGKTFIVRGDIRGREHIKSKEDFLNSISQEITEKLGIEMDEHNPDWIIQIEVVGENTGISVLKSENFIKKL